jgi:predicted negative regulator of RcsB-dependent stress response
MNDELLGELISELKETRTSFNDAINSIKWNKRNTVIQYILIVVVFFLGALAFISYRNYQQQSCERSNELKIAVDTSSRENAFAIGAALAVVFNAPQERLDQYVAAYNDQRPQRIELREC